MLEKTLFRLFLVCLVTCASLVLFIIWTGGPDSARPQIYFQTAATLFIVGLASFLTWFSIMLYSLRDFLNRLFPSR